MKATLGLSYLRKKGAEVWQGDTIIALAVGDESATYEIIRRWNYHEELLDLLKAAVARVEVANNEGDNIMSAWLPDAKAAIQKAGGE